MIELAALPGRRVKDSADFLTSVDRRLSEVLTSIVQIGAALELLHSLALMRDNVTDESESRRGRPSLYKLASKLHLLSFGKGNAQRFGESIAVLVGDLAHAEADHLIAGLPLPIREIWRRLVIELVYGQSRDIIESAAGCGDLSQACQVARMKLGSYTIERPLQLAAAAGASWPLLAPPSRYVASSVKPLRFRTICWEFGEMPR